MLIIGYWKPEEIVKLFRIIERMSGLSLLGEAVDEWIQEERKEENKIEDDSRVRRRKDVFTKMFEVTRPLALYLMVCSQSFATTSIMMKLRRLTIWCWSGQRSQRK